MQALDSELSRSSKAGFDQQVWRERTKNLEAKEAVAAAEAAAAAAIGNGAADSGHDSDHESAKAGSSSSQVCAIKLAGFPDCSQCMCKSAIANARPIRFPNEPSFSVH